MTKVEYSNSDLIEMGLAYVVTQSEKGLPFDKGALHHYLETFVAKKIASDSYPILKIVDAVENEWEAIV